VIVIHSFKEAVNLAHLILYENLNFQGRYKDVFQSQQSLGDFNRLTSSIVIREGHWQFFTGANFQGQTGPSTLGPGTYHRVEDVGIRNDTISSVKLVQG
jgi:hypothetical protein